MTFFNALKHAIFRLYFCILFTAGNPNREFHKSEDGPRRNVNSKAMTFMFDVKQWTINAGSKRAKQ